MGPASLRRCGRPVWHAVCDALMTAGIRSSRAEHDELRASGPAVRRQRGPAPRRRVGGRPGTSPTTSSGAAASSASSASTTPRAGAGAAATSRPGSSSSRSSPGAARARSRWRSSVQTDMATPALAEFGTDDQRERWLRPAIAGTKIGAIAITEPDAGSDVAGDPHAARSATATSGASTAARCSSPTARAPHFLTLVAKTDAGRRPPRRLAVHRRHRRCRACRSRGGSRSSGCTRRDTAEIALDDVAVPAARPHRPRTGPRLRAADVAAAVRAARGRGRVRRPRRADARRDDRVRARARRRSDGRSRSTR